MALQAGDILEFGIDTPTTTYGLYQDHTVTKAINRATARGAAGATVSTQEFDPTTTLNLNYVVLATETSEPEIGTKFTFLTVEYQIDSIAKGNTVDGFATKDITAIHYPSATIA